MSKYIDIMKICKENKDFTLDIIFKSYRRHLKCKVYKNGISVVENGKIFIFEFLFKSRRRRALRFTRRLGLLAVDDVAKQPTRIRVNNDYEFELERG